MSRREPHRVDPRQKWGGRPDYGRGYRDGVKSASSGGGGGASGGCPFLLVGLTQTALRVLPVTAAVIVLALAGCDRNDRPPADTLDCSDFVTQPQAQRAHDLAQTTADPDPHRLDDDGDGDACENLPEHSEADR